MSISCLVELPCISAGVVSTICPYPLSPCTGTDDESFWSPSAFVSEISTSISLLHPSWLQTKVKETDLAKLEVPPRGRTGSG